MKAPALHRHLSLTTLAASLVFTCSSVSAQQPLLLDTSEVRVMVRDTTGLPVRDARVVMHVMKRGADQGDMEVRTDQDGKVEQDIIPIGNTVHLEIMAPGYQAYRTDYQVNALVKNLVIRLKQQPVLESAVVEQTREVAKTTTPAHPSAYQEPRWVGRSSAKKTQPAHHSRTIATASVKN